MKKYAILILVLILFKVNLFGQVNPDIRIVFSKTLATYHFVNQLSEYKPDNEYKQLFRDSEFNTRHYVDLINQLDTLNIHESYSFQGYPTGQKIPVMTSSLIERNLITSKNLQEFKQLTFGIIPGTELSLLSNIIEEFEPIYDDLIYKINKDGFENKIIELSHFVDESNLEDYFERGLYFYNSEWDLSIPIIIAVIPSIKKEGFTASAFLNNAICEVPLNFNRNDILFSVLMHEIYHSIYNEQSLQFKLEIEKWFNMNPSMNSQYAYLLLNEVLATAMGNGVVFKKLNGNVDDTDWYNVKYINAMAKQIYPVVITYYENKKSIDKKFVDGYIAFYDKLFSEWSNELDHIMAYRFVLTENAEDFNYFRRNYPYSSLDQSQFPISISSLELMKHTPITKVIVVSSDNENKLTLIRNSFTELNKTEFNADKEFAWTTDLADRTKLIIVNQLSSSIEELFAKNFQHRRIEKE